MVQPDRQTRLHPRLVVGVVLVVVALVFVVENGRETKIRFIVPQVTAPLWIGLSVAALLGAVAGGLIARHIAAPELRQLRRRRDHNERPPSP
jgi:uncharacterized integral membrane protein